MRLIEDDTLRERTDVFSDRSDGGRVLARLLQQSQQPRAQLLAIPAGGVPVAIEIARALGWPLDVAVVSKITLPWNTEAGYGAVAFDGSVLLNDELVQVCQLSEEQVAQGIERTRVKVARRVERLRGKRGALPIEGNAAMLVDDGLASGFTMLAAARACRHAGAAQVIVAVPTGHARAIARVGEHVELVVCANVRSGATFAVADAYQSWSDVPEAVAEMQLEKLRDQNPA